LFYLIVANDQWIRDKQVIHNENLLVEVENSKIYVYSYDSLCASDTVNLWYRL
jgi:hypothetical protein